MNTQKSKQMGNGLNVEWKNIEADFSLPANLDILRREVIFCQYNEVTN